MAFSMIRRYASSVTMLVCSAPNRSVLLLALCQRQRVRVGGPQTMHEHSKSQEVVEPTVDHSIYDHVVELGLVVKDLDKTVNYWERLGFRTIRRLGTHVVPDITYRGKKSPLTLKMAEGDIGGVRIKWIEPVKGISC